MSTIGVDFGCCNLKTSEGVIIPALVTKGNEYLITTGYQLEYDNELYIIGEGSYDTKLNKLSKNNLLPMLCLGLALSSKDEFVKIVSGLPINQYKNKKDELVSLLQENRILEFKLNGDSKKYYVSDVAVFPEGVATYYSISYEERKALMNKDLIILDIGGRTTDIALLKAGRKRSVSKSTSLDVGMLNVYTDLINEINTKFTLGLNIEDAQNIISNGLEIDGEKQNISFIKDIVLNNISKIFKEINISYPARTSPLLVTGGGGAMFYKSIKKRYPTARLVENNILSNAIGYKRVGEKLWQD